MNPAESPGTQMEFLEIAGTDLRPSRIALGTWAIGGTLWGGTDADEAVRTLHAAVERGITLVDTAPVYGLGRAEELVGEAIARAGARDRVLVATKAGLEWDDAGRVRRNSRPTRIRREVEESLRRLKTDYIDLYQVHWPDPLVPIEETAAAMRDLYTAGLVRAIGVSNYSREQMAAFGRVAPLHTSQPPYNLFEREAERDVVPWCFERRVATLVYGVLCRGLLSGRMTPDTRFEGDDLRKVDPKFQPPRYAQYLAAVHALDAFARERYGKTVLTLAVRWALDQTGVGCVLWGARRPAQLDPVADALGWRLDDEALREVDAILRAHVTDPVGPEFMAPPAREG